jgi:tetratricopeptide (TPR) repeat protein
VAAVSQGNTWTISLGPGDHAPPGHISVGRDPDSGFAALKAPVSGATRVVRLADPVVGDEVTVVTALGPAKGVGARRDYVQLSLLESAQGLAVETHADGVRISREGDIVHLGRDKGLALSPNWVGQEQAQGALGAPAPAGMPALIDYVNWPKTGPAGFMARYDGLLAAATAESGNKDKDGPVEARMALARFLVGSDLSFEAIGVLNATARLHPELLDRAEFRGLRGAARVMARRYKEAEADFSSPALAEDPSSALWKGYIASQLGQWAEARTQFARGLRAYASFSPAWKARFARGDATAALEQGDLVGADGRVQMALDNKVDALEELATRLVQARVAEAQGHTGRALRIYVALTGAPAEYISAPAQLHATQIRLASGAITPNQAAGVFDGLRYRWRGDATELDTVRALGQLYLAQGRYREALEALRSAGGRLPDRPESLQLQADLNAAFRALFLDGMADGLEPVQALALFFDFKDLTPVGADGDLMVRKLVRRLVDVDLLTQAADLLKYQVDNRLDGAAKAQVATDLAVIYLMDRKPEQALTAINGSRTTILPGALNAERRLIEARAWEGLGRFDSALEIIDRDPSSEAGDLRAEIAWKQKNWAVAAPLLEKGLGQRWKDPTPLTGDEEGRLLRAGVAYSLAGDNGSLARLNQQYKGFLDQARNPEALRVALTGDAAGRLSVADFGRVSADNAAFEGWVAKMKVRFRTPNTAPATPTKQAQAAPAATSAKKS